MSDDNRSFIAKYSRILRKTLATKVLVDWLVRHTLARFAGTRRLFHLYLKRGAPSSIPHTRLDDGQPVRVESAIDAEMEAHLHTYDHGLEGCLEPGKLILTADVRALELRDCEILPWLGITLHRPSDTIIEGGADAQPRLVFRKRTIPGRVMSVVYSPRGHNQYYHFFESLTVVLRALRRIGAAEPVTMLVRKNLSSFQRVTLEALTRRLPHVRLLEVDNYEIVRPERLVVVTREPCPIICWFALVDEWRELGAMVREAYGPVEGPGDRRVYFSRHRQRVRRLGNEAELEPVFKRFGFEIIAPETASHAEQVKLMQRVSKVAGGEGAALTNIIFADRPITLYLMCPREILNPFWEGLTVMMGHRFRYVDSGPAGWFDQFDVQPEVLTAALEREGYGAA